MAEGEELRSNLLRVAHSSRGYPVGSDALGPNGRKHLRRLKTVSPLTAFPRPYRPQRGDRSTGSRVGVKVQGKPPALAVQFSNGREAGLGQGSAFPRYPPIQTPFASNSRPFELEATPADPPS